MTQANKILTLELITAEILAFVNTHFTQDKIKAAAESPLAEVGVDSFVLMELILFIERKFSLAIPLAILTPANTHSVNTLAKAFFELS